LDGHLYGTASQTAAAYLYPALCAGAEFELMDRYDLLAIIGLLFASIGCALIYAPLGLIVAGIGIMALAALGASYTSGQRSAPQPTQQAYRKDTDR